MQVVRSFRSDKRGNFSLMFALMLPAALCAGGAMLDYTRISDARASLQNIADSSALAANSYSINTLAQVQAAVGNFVQGQASLNRMLQDVTTTATMSADGRTIDVQITARVRNVIMSMFGSTFADLAVTSRTIRGQDSTLELALVLDNTGSMADSASNGQSKIANLRTAATTLINTLTSDPNNKVKIALVPFTQNVNIGTTNRSASFMSVPANYSQTTCNNGRNGKCTTTNYVWTGCVGSRVGYNTVDVPNPLYPGRMIASGTTSPCPAVPVQPLSTNFSGLKTQIGTMSASGSTYIPGGLMWGWNVLSPGAPFTEGAAYDPNNRKPRKAIVLMTDGENTASMLPDGSHEGSTRADADAATVALCANAKAQNIEIFTIAFMVTDAAAKSMLQTCASDGAHYFDASDASSFQIAFAKIAYALRTPYIAS